MSKIKHNSVANRSKYSAKVHPVASNPITTPSNNSGSFMKIFKESIVAGVGSSIGSRVIDNILGPRTIQVKHEENSNSHQTKAECSSQSLENFYQCIKSGGDDCDSLIPVECKSNNNK